MQREHNSTRPGADGGQNPAGAVGGGPGGVCLLCRFNGGVDSYILSVWQQRCWLLLLLPAGHSTRVMSVVWLH